MLDHDPDLDDPDPDFCSRFSLLDAVSEVHIVGWPTKKDQHLYDF